MSVLRAADLFCGAGGSSTRPTVYLCAAWHRQAQMRGVRDRLVAAGIAVTSRWLEAPAVPDDAGAAAVMDLDDLARADEVIAYTETAAAGYLTGGRHVELGYAIAVGKPIWLVGPPENVFHHHPLVQHVDRVETVLRVFARRSRA